MYEVQSSYIVLLFARSRVGGEGRKVASSATPSKACRPASFKCKRAVNWYFPLELNQKLAHDLAGKFIRNF